MNSYVLITGASRGIGAHIAEALAQKKYNLILTCRNSYEALTERAAYLSETYQVRVIAKCCNMGDPISVKSLFQEIPNPEIIINNAGISYVGLLQDMEPAEWNEVLSVNLSSAFYTAKYGLSHMIANGHGRILNISSVWGNTGASMEVAYSASKGGLNTFTKALAKEVAPSGIAVNALSCGYVDTAMNSCFSPEELNALCEEIPLGRPASPEEVAQAALHILEMPVYFTGQIVTIDGAWI
ncbi:MAG: SDR family NAD(P)-dependent oxidoreductase [Lachnospiraceae bacterium]|nr:SDR family NAD(P)-dependent oxidoreductase [Lachnospiraceae bacterium]